MEICGWTKFVSACADDIVLYDENKHKAVDLYNRLIDSVRNINPEKPEYMKVNIGNKTTLHLTDTIMVG